MLWWPLIGLPLMVLLGLAVGDGSTPVDDWFQQARGGGLGRLLFFTDYRTVLLMLAAVAALALYRRRWFLAGVVVVTPVAAVWLSRLRKELFGRQKGGALAYPSGHTTLVVTVLGMVGQAVTYRCFTDAVGAALLGTSMACLAAAIVSRARHRSFADASP